MRIVIAAIGRLKDGGESDLCERYQKRFAAAGRALALGPLELKEFAESKASNAALRKDDEAARLLKAVAATEVQIALDERGLALSSDAFAKLLAKKRDEGTKGMAFIIGGPDGHGAAIAATAGITMSLGPMTLPHGIARIVLLEQLYRATTILSSHPYHRA
jgi:23S rRNA (pseudouridine1915-N3)-methyltransferase